MNLPTNRAVYGRRAYGGSLFLLAQWCLMVEYLETPIADKRRTDTPRYGMAADGYTLRSGAPTQWLVRLDGEKRWRRLMCWQFSNAGTCFVRIGGKCLIVRNLPE